MDSSFILKLDTRTLASNFHNTSGLQTVKDVKFDTLSIWVQCYNIPLVFMHKEVLHKVGCVLGVVEEVDTKENGLALSRFARIRVCIDITKPLRRSIHLSVNPGDESICIILSYERLPDFCYRCGCIGHPFRECEIRDIDQSTLDFGPWLRAPIISGWLKNRKSAVKTQLVRHESHADANSSGNMEILGDKLVLLPIMDQAGNIMTIIIIAE